VYAYICLCAYGWQVDGEIVWGPLYRKGFSEPVSISVPVPASAKLLRLVLDAGDSCRCDKPVWAGAALSATCAPATCKECSKVCSTCFGEAATQCTGCASEEILVDYQALFGESSLNSGSVCLGECPNGSWYDVEKGQCAICSSCHPGDYVASNCTATEDTTCTPCGVNEFTSTVDAPQCRTHSVCEVGTAQQFPPSATSDRLCEECDGEATFTAKRGSLVCKPVSECPPGSREAVPPSPSSDRTCAECHEDSWVLVHRHDLRAGFWPSVNSLDVNAGTCHNFGSRNEGHRCRLSHTILHR